MTPAEFLEANRRFNSEAVPHIDGLERREVVSVGEGEYVVVARFTSRDHFDRAPLASGDYPAAAAFMNTIDPASLELEVHTIIAASDNPERPSPPKEVQ